MTKVLADLLARFKPGHCAQNAPSNSPFKAAAFSYARPGTLPVPSQDRYTGGRYGGR